MLLRCCQGDSDFNSYDFRIYADLNVNTVSWLLEFDVK